MRPSWQDVWALGVLAFELMHNCMPFRGESIANINVRIIKCSHEKFGSSISSRGRSLVKSLLTVDPAERPNASMATRAFEEAYLDTGGEESMSHELVGRW